jgi:predicted transcriptional regulator of viral defense system
MDKKYTATLSAKELMIIEKLITSHGDVVSSEMIYEQLGKSQSKQVVKNFITVLVKKGWLVRIKKGIFVITNIAGRGNIELSQLALAQIIDSDAYISFEGALQYHGLFDQYLRIISSVGKKRTYSKKFAQWSFKFIKAKKGLFGDFKIHHIDGQLVRVASKEKAIIDFLLYRRTKHDFDLIIEKLSNYQHEFDLAQLIAISKNCSITIKRMLGLVLDIAEIDSSALYAMVKKNKNHSFVHSTSHVFNAKWRIYTDEYFVK